MTSQSAGINPGTGGSGCETSSGGEWHHSTREKKRKMTMVALFVCLRHWTTKSHPPPPHPHDHVTLIGGIDSTPNTHPLLPYFFFSLPAPGFAPSPFIFKVHL